MSKKNALDWAKQMSTFELTTLNLPEGFELFKFVPRQDGKPTRIDIIPYIAGNGNSRSEEGLEYWQREYSIHRIPMGGNKMGYYCCPYLNWGKKCPVCEFIDKGEGSEELIKRLKPQSRMLMNVIDHSDKEGKIKILDVGIFNKKKGFGEQLQQLILTDPDTYMEFYDLENGYTLKLTLDEDSWNGRKFTVVTRMDFIKRSEPLSKLLIKKTCCLDDILIKPSYEKLEKVLHSGDMDEDEEKNNTVPKNVDNDEAEEDEKLSKKSVSRDDELKKEVKSKKSSEDDDEEEGKVAKEKTAMDLGIKQGDIVEYEEDEFIVAKVSKDGTSLSLTTERGSIKIAIDPNDCVLIKNKTVNEKGKIVSRKKDDDEEDEKPKKVTKKQEEDEDEEPPIKKKGRPTKKKVEEEEDSDEEDEEDESDSDDDDD